MNTTLIVYYSYDGNCRLIAEKLHSFLSADTLELKVKNEKRLSGLKKMFLLGKQAKMKETPELESIACDLSHYSTILIGTPVWAWTMTPAVRSFLTQYKIEGKRIAFFCTHGGNPGKTFVHMKELLKNNEIIGELAMKEPKADAPEGVAEICKEWVEGLQTV